MSVEFRPLTMDDNQWISQLFSEEKEISCECNYCTLFLWGKVYDYKAARVGDRLLIRVSDGHKFYYMYPSGKGNLKQALEVLRENAHANGQKLRFINVTKKQMEELKKELSGDFKIEERRNSWDYIYDINRLAELSGKKLHAKRNHIHRFEEQFSDWTFEAISLDNISACIALENEWIARKTEETEIDKNIMNESLVVMKAFQNWEALKLEGGAIRADGKLLAFSLGSLTTEECFNVHIEKACDEVQGAYAIINREMARMVRNKYPQVKWINREDDLGLDGLRKAKLSYYPDLLLEKYIIYEE